MDAENLDDISADAERVTLPGHSLVFREGDRVQRVYLPMTGIAKLTRLLPDGKQQVVGFRFSGDMKGLTSRSDYPFEAKLLTGATLCRLARPDLKRLLIRYTSAACCIPGMRA